MTFKVIISAIAVVPAVLFAGPLQAQTVDLDTRTVSYGDLDLSSNEGRKTLDRRLSQAVDQVCGELNARSALVNRRIRECRAATLADAHAQRDTAIAQFPTRTTGDRELVLRGR